MFEWRLFGVGAILLALGIAVWLVLRGVGAPAIGAGVALGVLLLVGASPVWASALLRGREERTARVAARAEGNAWRRQ